LYTEVQRDGRAEHIVAAFPDQKAFSTSGELRLTGRWSAGNWHHELILLARGRDVLARYGGEDVVDLGPDNISAEPQVPEPTFTYSPRTRDRTKLWSVGSAYHLDWDRFAELEVGIQKQNYRKTVASPGTPEGKLSDSPLRAYGNSALALTRLLTVYAGYTQGLEDSGAAPSFAQNAGAVLPASRTWQVESGARYLVTPRLKVIAGVYELQKPYFNLDTNGVDRELGVQRAKGGGAVDFGPTNRPFRYQHRHSRQQDQHHRTGPGRRGSRPRGNRATAAVVYGQHRLHDPVVAGGHAGLHGVPFR
jgi:iron complex outermembrane recepter protein